MSDPEFNYRKGEYFSFEDHRINFEAFKKHFRCGSKVISTETIQSGQWYQGKKLTKPLINTNYGIVVDHSYYNSHLHVQIKLTSGHLYDLDTYNHDDFWHTYRPGNIRFQ